MCAGRSLEEDGHVEKGLIAFGDGGFWVKMGRREKWKDAVVGNYDWRFLCMPTPPWKKNRATTPYFGKDEKIPLAVALVMGLQHALAMVSISL